MRRRSVFLLATCACLALATAAQAQINVIHQEGFNDDGVAAGRYSMKGRGALTGGDGPGAWEHNFLVDAIGLPSSAVERRAAILWTDEAEEIDFTEESTLIWDNLLNYMLDGTEEGTVGFLPSSLTNTADFLAAKLEDAGHTIIDLDGDLPPSRSVDLVIHTAGGNPPSPTDLVNYRAPVITYNAGNHDDTAVSSIGRPTTGGPTTISINQDHLDHPVLEGITGESIPWVDEFLADTPLQGIGGATPPGATILATYVDPETELTLPALMVIERGDDLLGAFAPIPEGDGYIIGGDLNLDLDSGDGAGVPESPVSVTLNPVDLSGQTGVKVSIDLAATTVDFEPADFLRVGYLQSDDPDFEDLTVLAEFIGLDDANSASNKSLVDADMNALVADEFTTFTYDIPDDVDNFILRVEAFNTFPNEIIGIDNVVVFTGEELAEPTCEDIAAMRVSGDADGSGDVGFLDFLAMANNFGAENATYDQGDFNCSGTVDFLDFLALANNFGSTAAEQASAVPEPTSIMILALGALGLLTVRRKR